MFYKKLALLPALKSDRKCQESVAADSRELSVFGVVVGRVRVAALRDKVVVVLLRTMPLNNNRENHRNANASTSRYRALCSLVHVGLVTVFTGSCCRGILLSGPNGSCSSAHQPKGKLESSVAKTY